MATKNTNAAFSSPVIFFELLIQIFANFYVLEHSG